MTYQAASGAGAQNMRELLTQMGEAHRSVKALLDDPASAYSISTAEVAGILRDEKFPTSNFRRAAGGQPDSMDRQGSGQRAKQGRVEGQGGDNKILRPRCQADFPLTGCACVSARALP